MLGRAQKASSILGCMRWRLLRFAQPVVAYSDQPVVIWPVGRLVVDERPNQPTLGPLSALEIRIPISPTQILLMTWDDVSDDELPVAVPMLYAAETNALVIAQADEQWMHRPGEEPPVASHLLRPISGALDPSYDHNIVQRSLRRRTAAQHFDRVADRPFVNTVQLITSISRGPVSRTRAGLLDACVELAANPPAHAASRSARQCLLPVGGKPSILAGTIRALELRLTALISCARSRMSRIMAIPTIPILPRCLALTSPS